MSDALEQYAANLPPIYRDVLAVFPKVDPARKMGYGLAFQTIAVALDNKYSVGDIQIVSAQFANRGIAEIRNGIFVHPTPLGEQLIAMLSGLAIPESHIPPLPPPPVVG